MRAREAIAKLQEIRINLLFEDTESKDSFENKVFAEPMFLEALATIEVAQRKLEQAELFRARESAGNF